MNQGRAQVPASRSARRRDGKVAGLQAGPAPGRRRLPGIGAFLPSLTALMASGVYAIPKIEIDIATVVDEHHADRSLPRRRAARGEPDPGARDGHAGRRAGLDPAELRRRNFIPADAFPYTTVSGARYDSGDYEGALDLALRVRRLRAAACRSEAPAGRGRGPPARHRHVRLRGGDQRPAREGVRRGADHRGGRGGPAHRLVLARPGARDHLRDDRRRAAGHAGGEDPGAEGRHRCGAARHRHLRLEVHPDRRRRRARRLPTRWWTAPSGSRPTCSRPPPRTSCWTSTRAVSTWPARRSRLLLERAGGQAEGRRPPLRAQRGARLRGRVPHLPVRRAHRRGRGGHGHGLGRSAPPHRRGRRRGDHQPGGGRRPGARRRGTGIAQALFEEVMYDEDGNPVTGSFASYASRPPPRCRRSSASRWRRSRR